MSKCDIRLNKLKSYSANTLPGTKNVADLIERLKEIAQQCDGEFDEFEGRLYITLTNSERWLEFELKNDDVWVYEMSIGGIRERCRISNDRIEWITEKSRRKDSKRKTADLKTKERRQAIRSMKSSLKKQRARKETTKIIRDRLKERRSEQILETKEEPHMSSRAFHQNVSNACGTIDSTKTCRECANRGAAICPNGGLQVCEYWQKIQHRSGFWPE